MHLLPQLGIVLLMAALAIGGGYWITGAGSKRDGGSPGNSRSNSPIVVEIAHTQLGQVKESVPAVGTARAAHAVKIVSTTAGLVTRVAFHAGQRVAPGMLLIELDNESEQAAVHEAESELTNLRLQMKRAESLLERKLLSAAELDELRARFGMAEARLAAARSRLQKRMIRAPFAGVVGLRNINAGSYIDSDTVLTTLDDLDTIELEFRVPERYFGAVHLGQTVSATSAAFPDHSFTGAVHEVDTRIDPTARAFRVRAKLPNPDALLPDGLFMAVRLTIAKRDNAVLAPEEAVISEDGQSYVYVVMDGIALKTAITTGQRLDAAIEILAGLPPDAKVVTRGHQSLRDRSPVKIYQQGGPSP
ncbi:MAG TPA: efflux transporter periplasmic adaptor subunit [Gammaproteobacteria bacterium]|nr:efflux transporter periplasmic adaptor subunit [Gammaproteobacteria bacterium]HRF45610.1 efflux RND transporter periplasmic adaptor subunit [Candidatus Competibacteraceae bacterium]